MACGGYVRLPSGSVVVALSLPRAEGADPHGPPSIRVLVHAANRQRALTRLRNRGLRAVRLHGNSEPPTPDEITAVLHHPDGLVWRCAPHDGVERWHPIGSLLRAAPRQRAARTSPSAPVVPAPRAAGTAGAAGGVLGGAGAVAGPDGAEHRPPGAGPWPVGAAEPGPAV